jgi:hypothetical protein
MTLADRVRRIPRGWRAVQILVALTLVARIFHRAWIGAFEYAVLIVLIVVVVGEVGTWLRRRRLPRG